MEAAGSHAPVALGRAYTRSYRLLRLLSDERLVGRVRAGSEEAFAVLYERYYRSILSFCRHMLGSREEAEDAVQQTFVNAYRDIVRNDKELKLRPWLYRIARNHCISVLRARRPQVELSDGELSFAGLSEQVGRRAELRDLLRDLATLPDDQREALVLAELHDNSHAEVAEIIGCEREKVKSLVFQARSSLMKSREAREIPCEEIRRQVSVLTGGALRRGVINRHLRGCESCRAFSREVKRQRQGLALLLPVVPTATLKLGAANAIAAAGVKAGTGGGAAAVAATQGAAAGGATASTAAGVGTTAGPLGAIAGKIGVSTLALKGTAVVVAVTVAAGGGAVAVKRAANPSGNGSPALERPADTGTPAAHGKPGAGSGAAAAPSERAGGKGRGRVQGKRHRRVGRGRRTDPHGDRSRTKSGGRGGPSHRASAQRLPRRTRPGARAQPPRARGRSGAEPRRRRSQSGRTRRRSASPPVPLEPVEIPPLEDGGTTVPSP